MLAVASHLHLSVVLLLSCVSFSPIALYVYNYNLINIRDKKGQLLIEKKKNMYAGIFDVHNNNLIFHRAILTN
jgi:hypothetical protein